MRINWHDSKASSDYLTIAVANRQTQMLQYEPLTSPRREERIPLEKINEYGPSPKRLKEHASAVAASNNARIQKEPQSNESRQQPKIQRSVGYRNPQISQDSRKRKVLLRFRQIQKDIPRDILGTANKIYTDGCSFEAMTGWFKKCSKKGRRPIRALRRLYYVDEDQYEPSFCTSLLNVCESLTVEEVPAILSVLALYSDVFAVIQKGYQGSEIDERERVYMPEIKHNVKQCRILKIRYSVMAILGDDKLFDALNQCNHLPHFNVEKTKCLNKADFAIEKWVELIEHCHLTSNSIINESGKKLMRELFGTNVMFQNESVKGINPRAHFLARVPGMKMDMRSTGTLPEDYCDKMKRRIQRTYGFHHRDIYVRKYESKYVNRETHPKEYQFARQLIKISIKQNLFRDPALRSDLDIETMRLYLHWNIKNENISLILYPFRQQKRKGNKNYNAALYNAQYLMKELIVRAPISSFEAPMNPDYHYRMIVDDDGELVTVAKRKVDDDSSSDHDDDHAKKEEAEDEDDERDGDGHGDQRMTDQSTESTDPTLNQTYFIGGHMEVIAAHMRARYATIYNDADAQNRNDVETSQGLQAWMVTY